MSPWWKRTCGSARRFPWSAARIASTALRRGSTSRSRTKSELHNLAQHEQGDIKDDIDGKHKKKVRKTGFTGAGALDVHTGLPAVGSDARGAVEGNLNPDNKTSIPARAGSFDENVQAWASPDKKVGEGRANPMGVVEDMEGRDIKDTGKKVWDKLTGGDGTADGEKLNDNKKREDNLPGWPGTVLRSRFSSYFTPKQWVFRGCKFIRPKVAGWLSSSTNGFRRCILVTAVKMTATRALPRLALLVDLCQCPRVL